MMRHYDSALFEQGYRFSLLMVPPADAETLGSLIPGGLSDIVNFHIRTEEELAIARLVGEFWVLPIYPERQSEDHW